MYASPAPRGAADAGRFVVALRTPPEGQVHHGPRAAGGGWHGCESRTPGPEDGFSMVELLVAIFLFGVVLLR